MRWIKGSDYSLYDYLRDYQGLTLSERQLPLNISCPLHTDNKPSLRLYSPKDRDGYCFSCGKSYGSVSMHAALTGATAYEANRELADFLGIELDDSLEGEREYKTSTKLVDIAREVKVIKSLPESKLKKNFRILERKIINAKI